METSPVADDGGGDVDDLVSILKNYSNMITLSNWIVLEDDAGDKYSC